MAVTYYRMRLSFKFCKDPSFGSGDISLFVTVFDLELKILLFSKTHKNAILSCNKYTLRLIFLNFFLWEWLEVLDLPQAKNNLEFRLLLASHEWVSGVLLLVNVSHIYFKIYESLNWNNSSFTTIPYFSYSILFHIYLGPLLSGNI